MSVKRMMAVPDDLRCLLRAGSIVLQRIVLGEKLQYRCQHGIDIAEVRQMTVAVQRYELGVRQLARQVLASGERHHLVAPPM